LEISLKRSVFRGLDEVKFYFLFLESAVALICVCLRAMQSSGAWRCLKSRTSRSWLMGSIGPKSDAGEFCLTGLNMASLAPLSGLETAYRYGL
jgi:hypothetical protein